MAVLTGVAACAPLALVLGLRWAAAGRHADHAGRRRFLTRSAGMLGFSLVVSIALAWFGGVLALPALPSLLLLLAVAGGLVRTLRPRTAAETDGTDVAGTSQ